PGRDGAQVTTWDPARTRDGRRYAHLRTGPDEQPRGPHGARTGAARQRWDQPRRPRAVRERCRGGVVMGRIADAWRRLTRGVCGERGVVEAGVAAAGAVLVVGALVGNGVASTVIDMSDGQTWLPDENGRIVQI